MVTIVTRAGKGSQLEHAEADANFTNLKAAIEAAQSTIAAIPTTYQPLDSDLTAIAALTTTAFGRAFLVLADAAAARAAIGAGTGAPVSVRDVSTVVGPVTTLLFNGAPVIDGGGGLAVVSAAITPTTIAATDATDASSSTAAAVKTAGGLAVAKKAYVGTDLHVGADAHLNQMANGQGFAFKALTEELTIAAAAASDTAIQIPVNAMVFKVTTRVTAAIPTAATFIVGIPSSPSRFQNSGISTALNTTDAGLSSLSGVYSTPEFVRITPNLTPADASGRVRVTIHFLEITPASS